MLGIGGLIPFNQACAQMRTQEGTPPGFEGLQTARPTVITLYYGGELLGVYPAHMAPGKLAFDHPEVIVEAIPSIADEGVVGSVLASPLDTHPEKLCTQKPIDDCGKLLPEIAGIIFDEVRLSAELFINKEYLSVVDAASTRYLPLPHKEFSSVYAFNGAVNGTQGEPQNYTFSDNAIYSYGEMRLNTQSTLANDGLRFDTVNASRERNGWNETAGLFRSRAMQLISDRDIAGASVSTSIRTRLDSRKTEGNDIIIYLARRSFVSIYREGRLYSSRTYEAGNQRIDTSELPEGAYEITLRIQEADGATHEEKRFFAKTSDIPPPGEPLFWAQAGVIRKPASIDSTIPQLTSDPIIRLGTAWRSSENIGLSADLLGTKDRALMEAGLFWLAPGLQIHTAALASTRGDLGVQASSIYTKEKFNAAVDARKLSVAKQELAGYADLLLGNTQISATASYAVYPDVTLGTRASYAKQTATPTSISFGPYAEWNIWQEGESMLVADAGFARTEGHNEGNILLNFTHRFGQYGATSTGGAGFGGSGSGLIGSARVWHDDPTPGNTLLLGAGVAADSQQKVGSADADWRNRFGNVHGSIQESIGQTRSLFSYGGNFAFNAAQLGTDIHVGGDETDKSALIIDTEGDADAYMKIFVNGMERSRVRVGSRQIIYLTPFHMYNIRIAPEKSAMLDYESADRKVTLYPGNVVQEKWKVSKFYVVTAHVVTPDQEPLINAILQEGKGQASTDDHGRLQAELSYPETLTFTKDEMPFCRVALDKNVKPINGVLIYPTPLTCQFIN